MIQPQELRIGNYYQGASRGNIEIVTWQTLRDLSEGKLNLLPIQITEEILLKFGFDKGKIDWFAKKYFTDCDECAEVMKVDYNLSSKRLAIYDAIEETDMVNILSYPIYTGKRINYVHQLQNLYFALTGEELTFKK